MKIELLNIFEVNLYLTINIKIIIIERQAPPLPLSVTLPLGSSPPSGTPPTLNQQQNGSLAAILNGNAPSQTLTSASTTNAVPAIQANQAAPTQALSVGAPVASTGVQQINPVIFPPN